ncbi:MAG: 4-(cytidine 5'-diphospho)-2-C-methyl-D-erythritol kinase [Desulfohalobiaceae bacterium]|nr:4-(cytidine 5'-diphospho)-2-C-methyl-D-erythritol kinase [Desulfohalobiaceae bacterium]
MNRTGRPDQNPGRPLTLQAGCKVNLYLRILGKRDDSLHDLESVFLPLSYPRDSLRLEPAGPGSGLILSCSEKELETKGNILYTSYRLFGERTGYWPGLKVHLQKRIPFGSGLGGGSSDAAIFLDYINRLQPERQRLPRTELAELSRQIGSDIPFFLYNRPALVRGAGEKVNPLPMDLSRFILLLVCPDCRVSTKDAYKMWDDGFTEPGIQKDLTHRANRFSKYLCFTGFFLYNDFEQLVFADIPKLRSLKETLFKTGAEAAVLSGSGSTIVSLFRSKRCLSQACSWLSDNGITYYINRIGV